MRYVLGLMIYPDDKLFKYIKDTFGVQPIRSVQSGIIDRLLLRFDKALKAQDYLAMEERRFWIPASFKHYDKR